MVQHPKSNSQVSSVLFGDTMVPNIEQDYILHLGYSVLYKEYNLTRFNHQKKAAQVCRHLALMHGAYDDLIQKLGGWEGGGGGGAGVFKLRKG